MLSAIITFIYILVSNCGSETGFRLTRDSNFGGIQWIQLTQVFGWKCISAYELCYILQNITGCTGLTEWGINNLINKSNALTLNLLAIWRQHF